METYKPSQLKFLTKSTSKTTRKEDHVRLRALNGLLHKALTDMLCTPEVSQEICDLNVELSKVGLSPWRVKRQKGCGGGEPGAEAHSSLCTGGVFAQTAQMVLGTQ